MCVADRSGAGSNHVAIVALKFSNVDIGLLAFCHLLSILH